MMLAGASTPADLFRGGSKRCWLMAIAQFRQSFGPHQLAALHRVVAVDLLHIELAHEVDRLLGHYLSGHHDRETWRVRDDEIRRYQIGPVLQAPVDLRIIEAKIFATRSIVGDKESRANVTFIGPLAGVAAEALMEV